MKNTALPNQVRIIAGQWRGRKIHFPQLPGLRPSSDRVRETLFNWLMHEIAGARCLDLFAGSGILGLEGLSRGAQYLVAVDESMKVIKTLEENIKRLGAENVSCVCASWPECSSQLGDSFDVVFVDPPFNKAMVEVCCEWLEAQHLLKPKAWIYVEQEIAAALPKVSQSWNLHRQLTTQQVRALLYQKIS